MAEHKQTVSSMWFFLIGFASWWVAMSFLGEPHDSYEAVLLLVFGSPIWILVGVFVLALPSILLGGGKNDD